MALFSVIRRMRAVGPEETIDLPSMYVLYQVLVQPGVRVSTVAGEVGLDASTVSRHVQALTKLGYLARTRADDDKRAAALQITDRGRGVIEQVARSRAALFMEAFQGWTPEDRQNCVAYALRFAAALEKVRPFTGDAEPPAEPST